MSKRILRVQKPKRRRKWDINPATRIEESQKTYQRSTEKEHVREMLDQEISGGRREVKGRILGIDYGERRVGLAVSDPLGVIARGLDTLQRTTDEDVLDRLRSIIDEYAIVEIVVGHPLSLNGTPGAKAEEVTAFIDRLKEAFDLPVIPWDERMTTAAAHRTMHEMGQKAKGAKEKIDRIAAILILQGYLDRVNKGD